jgi:hypothetical protein
MTTQSTGSKQTNSKPKLFANNSQQLILLAFGAAADRHVWKYLPSGKLAGTPIGVQWN